MEYLEFAKKVAIKAGEIMLKYFKEDNKSEYKSDKTIVTIADKEINEYLIKMVKETYPTHSVDGEEKSFGESSYMWVCDPIDGTAMYARYIPVAVFSLALVVDGEPIIGVVYDPFTENMYTAKKGEGAFQNENIIHVNDINFEDKRAVANYDMWSNAQYNLNNVINKLGEKTYFVSIGSVIRGCVAVATGGFVCSIFPGTKRKNCDIAAAKVIIEEAGGKVTDLFGNEQKYDRDINGAIISNKIVHNEIVEKMKKEFNK